MGGKSEKQIREEEREKRDKEKKEEQEKRDKEKKEEQDKFNAIIEQLKKEREDQKKMFEKMEKERTDMLKYLQNQMKKNLDDLSSRLRFFEENIKKLEEEKKARDKELKEKEERIKNMKEEEKKKELEKRKNARDNFLKQREQFIKKFFEKLIPQSKDFIENLFKKEKNDSFPKKDFKKIFKTIQCDNNLLQESVNKEILSSDYQNLTFETEIKHFNILVLGPTGVGKSTLINAVLKLKGIEEAETGNGNNVTTEWTPYESSSVKGLRIWDTRGIELSKYDITEVEKDAKKLIQDKIHQKNTDEFIHCIWYCVTGDRFQDCEKALLKKLMKLYQDDTLPIIFVYTQALEEEKVEGMKKFIEAEINKDFNFIDVIAKEKIIKIGGQKFPVQPKGINELINKSFSKAEKASKSACFTSLMTKIREVFNDKLTKLNENLTTALKKEITKKLKEIENNTDIQQKVNVFTSIFQEILLKFLYHDKIPDTIFMAFQDYLNKTFIDWVNRLLSLFYSLFIEPKAKELEKEIKELEEKIANTSDVKSFINPEDTINYPLDIEEKLQKDYINQLFIILSSFLINELIKQANSLKSKLIEEGLKKNREFFRQEAQKTFNKVSKELLLISGYSAIDEVSKDS